VVGQQRGIVHAAKRSADGRWTECQRWDLGRRISAPIPRASGGIVLLCDTDVCTMDEAGNISVLVSLDVGTHHFHPNDAKCDSRGRLWAGTLDGDLNIAGSVFTPGRAALYRIDPDGAVEDRPHGRLPFRTVSTGVR